MPSLEEFIRDTIRRGVKLPLWVRIAMPRVYAEYQRIKNEQAKNKKDN